MAIKFLIDNLQREQEATIKKILEVVKKKPYPDKNTEHLATFVHALFQISPRTRQFSSAIRPQIQQRQPEPKPLQKEVVRYFKKPLPTPPKPFRAFQANLLPSIPMPSVKVPESQNITKRTEYTVLSFDTPIGIISDPQGENNKPTYTVIEPQLNPELFNKVKELVSKDVSKDYKILDDFNYLKDKVEKTSRILKIGFSEDNIPTLKYFLKRDLTGFRKLDPLMQDLNVKSIYIDGINKPVVVETSQFEKVQTNITLNSPEELNSLIKKIAKATGNEISEDRPIFETVFQGFKIQAVLGKGNTASKLIIKKVMA